MKLFYAPGACSLAPHIALVEAGLPYQLVRVDLGKHQLPDGTPYATVNPKGYVPTLELDDGTRLTEAAAVLQYIADRKPGTLAPALDTFEHYRLLEWLNFVATELHKGFGPLWSADTTEQYRRIVLERLATRFEFIAPVLARQPYLLGERFSIADAYLFTILNWHGMLKVDLSRWPSLTQYLARIAARPAVQRALAEEHLIKAAA